MLQLLTCSRGHSWEAAADDGTSIGRAVCPVCGDAVELLPLLDLAPSPEGVVLAPEPVLPQAPPLRDAAGKPVVAGFEIMEEVGRSPLGVRCYKAKQLLVNRTILLKVVVARDDAGQVGWGALRGEAAALGRLGHPNIVPILEAGERERQLFYNAVEWVEGPTLAEHAAARPMPPRLAARLVEVLARALHAAHEQGVAHRGLRPACIRLQPQPEGNKGRKSEPAEAPFWRTAAGSRCLPKIGDFGLARRPVEGDPADVELHDGAPSYLSPEQAWGRTREIGPSCDIYALGAILYELLTGRPPFRGRTPGETLDFIRGGDPPSLLRDARGLPADLAAVCRKAMQRNPRNRYQTALEFAEDLRAFVSCRPVRAWPRGAVGRLVLAARRRPLTAILLLISLLAPVGLLIAYLVGAGDASAARDAVGRANVLRETAESQRASVQRDVAEARKRELRATYLDHILLADRELRGGDLNRARQLLGDCPADLRDWEWRYLNYRTNTFGQPEYLIMKGTGPVPDFAFSPDGRQLAVASDGAAPQVGVWQLPSSETTRVLTGFTAPIRKIAWRPDGKRLAVVCSTDGKLGDRAGAAAEWAPAADGQAPPLPLALGQALPRDVAYSPDGKRLLVVDDHGLPHAFAAGGRDEMRLNVTTGGDWLSRDYRLAVLNPVGTKVAVVASFGLAVQIYDLQRGGSGVRAALHRDVIRALAFNPQANLLASAAQDGSVIVWDVQANRPVSNLAAHVGAVAAVSFTRDGHRLATAGDDGRIEIWDPVTGEEVYQLTPFGAGQGVTAMQFSPAGGDDRLAAAHGEEVRVYGPTRP